MRLGLMTWRPERVPVTHDVQRSEERTNLGYQDNRKKYNVLVSYRCYNKLSQTRWLTVTETFLLQFWRPEVRNHGLSSAVFLQ